MQPLSIVFVAVYLVALCCYFYTRTSGNVKWRAINKYVMATLYLVYAIVRFTQNYTLSSYHVVLMTALFLAYLGDLFLVFDLGRGGDYFLAGNVCFVAYYVAMFYNNGLTFANYYWVFIAWALLWGTFVVLSAKLPNVFKLGKYRWPMTFYLASIMMHGMCGLGAAVLVPGVPAILTGVGSVMFMISDMILTVDRFVVPGTKWIVRANSLFYFGGVLLIVLSLGY